MTAGDKAAAPHVLHYSYQGYVALLANIALFVWVAASLLRYVRKTG